MTLEPNSSDALTVVRGSHPLRPSAHAWDE